MKICIVLALCIGFLAAYEDPNYDWSKANRIIMDAVTDRAFPGAVALVTTKDKVIYAKTFGNFTYAIPPPNNPRKFFWG